MPVHYMLDAKNFAKLGHKYTIVFDETNEQSCIFAKKLSLELGFLTFNIEQATTKKNEMEGTLIILGGDGFLLRVAHIFVGKLNIKFYGINFGTIGFLLNEKKSINNLITNLESASESIIYPLRADITKADGTSSSILAINEISFLRQTNQASHLQIEVENAGLENLVCDGIVISTAVGSTAYNFSVHGPIFSPSAGLISICPISPFRPRHWRGALVSDKLAIKISCNDTAKRPTSLSGDFYFEADIKTAKITTDFTKPLCLLFNRNKTLETKVLHEQFVV